MPEVLEDKVVTLWVVMANHDPDQTYIYTDPDRAFRAVSDGVRAYLDPMQDRADTDEQVRIFEASLSGHWEDVVIPFQVFGLFMVVHRLELDRHNPLHVLLRRAYDVLDSPELGDGRGRTELLGQIGGLFRDTVN